MVLLIDNFDSFVFNLARYFRELGVETQVVRNNAITIAEVEAMRPQAIVLSPGPCTPNEAGICVELIQSLHRQFPIFGVCLGHQAIGAAFGATVSRAPEPVHGRTSLIQHSGSRLFDGISNPFRAARYHSLIVEEATLPPELIVTARTADGLVMAIEHASLPVCSVQFHPESVLTESGQRLLANFLRMAGLTITAEPTGDALGSESIGEWLHDELSDAVNSRWVIDGASERPLHW